MTPDDYVAALRREGDAFAAAIGDLDAPVASCPGWDVAELVWHMAGVHHFWGSVAAGRLQDPDVIEGQERPARKGLLDLYRANFGRLVTALDGADPEEPVWSWSPRKNLGFIQRRMAQETAVHRWDAESATGRPGDIDPALAADGIDEFLDLFIEDSKPEERPKASVHVHCTDVAGEWLVDMHGGEITLTREHAKGDAAVRGRASDLLLMLWRRVPIERAEVLGSEEVFNSFHAMTNLD